MAEALAVNELPRESLSEEDSYTDCSSETKVYTNHFGWKACHSSGCRSRATQGMMKPRKNMSYNEHVSPIYGEVLEGEDEGKDNVNACHLLKPILLNEEIFNTEYQSKPERTNRFHNVTVRIRDSRHKCLTLQEQQEGAHLVALFLQGNNLSKEVNMKMCGLVSSLLNGPTHKVALNIAGNNLYLSCISEQDTPVLSLTEGTDIEGMEEKDLSPFLFHRSANTDNGKNTFESVAFPGWYICTSQAENQFVLTKPQSDQEHIKDFLLYPAQ